MSTIDGLAVCCVSLMSGVISFYLFAVAADRGRIESQIDIAFAADDFGFFS